MKKLSPQKRNQLLLVAVATVVGLTVIYLSLISPKYDALARIAVARTAAARKLDTIQTTIQRAAELQTKLAEVSNDLVQAQDDMASGDLLAWTYNLLRRSTAPYKVSVPQIGQPDVSQVDLLPNFPYKQSKVSISGTAYYQDLGVFIADFENTFPHIRLVNLAVEPAAGAADQGERLSFRVDMVALIKPLSTSAK
ncbi:MAG: hypothetical protein KGJ60_14765 [Verrucomicrobiota bacterium]|nr:hypothetical protein [Verrucomicrobiota bacterium]